MANVENLKPRLYTREMPSKAYRLALKINKEEIGRCYVYTIKNDLHQEPYALLEDVFVKEEYRGEGFGKIIVQEAIKLAKDLGYYKIITTSRFGRDRLHKWYKKLGFKIWGYEFRIDLKE